MLEVIFYGFKKANFLSKEIQSLNSLWMILWILRTHCLTHGLSKYATSVTLEGFRNFFMDHQNMLKVWRVIYRHMRIWRMSNHISTTHDRREKAYRTEINFGTVSGFEKKCPLKKRFSGINYFTSNFKILQNIEKLKLEVQTKSQKFRLTSRTHSKKNWVHIAVWKTYIYI